MQAIELSFQYTESDYQEFLRHYFLKNRSIMYLVLAGLALLALTITQSDNIFSIRYLLSTLIPVSLILLLWWYLIAFMGRRQFRMAPQMQEGRNVTIDQEKITVVGHTFSSEFHWSGVLQVRETKSLYLVYNSKSSAVMLPKRAFTADQLPQFKQIVDGLSDVQVKWNA